MDGIDTVEQCLQELRRYSPNIGARDFSLPKDSQEYKDCEELLRKLFRKFGNGSKMEDVYRSFQNVRESEETDWYEVLPSLEKTVEGYDHSERWTSTQCERGDSHWLYVKVWSGRRSILTLVKVYVSLNDDLHVAKKFEEAAVALLEKARYQFYAKVAKIGRADSMCFWVDAADLPILRDCFCNEPGLLKQNLPFVPYWNGLGIGRELASWMSQNAAQADLMVKYFSTKTRPEDIDLEEMFSLFVRGWNGDLEEDHPLHRSHDSIDAHRVLVLLDSIEAVLGVRPLTEDSFLLSSDEDIWDAMGHAETWEEVAIKYTDRLSKKKNGSAQ